MIFPKIVQPNLCTFKNFKNQPDPRKQGIPMPTIKTIKKLKEFHDLCLKRESENKNVIQI